MPRPPSSPPARPAYWGHATTFFLQHRAFVRLVDGPARLLRALALGLALSAAWLFVLPYVLGFWTELLVLVNRGAGAPGQVVVTAHRWGALLVPVPHLSVVAPAPGWMDGAASLVGLLAFVWIAPRLSDRLAPLASLLRALALIHLTALVAFTLQHLGLYAFPYTADAEASVLAHVTLVVVSLLPIGLAVVYFVQDVRLRHKLALTALTMGFFVLFLPLLTAFHALALASTSLLWMPLLFLVAGVPSVVFLAISLYALGMSWSGPLLDAAPEATPWQPGHAHLRATGRLDGPVRPARASVFTRRAPRAAVPAAA